MSMFADESQREIFSLFLVDSRERLGQIQDDVMALERGGYSGSEEINRLFRNFHTIKGESGILELNELQSFAHDLEDRLMTIRDGKEKFGKDDAELVLGAADAIERYLEALDSGTVEGDHGSYFFSVGKPGGDDVPREGAKHAPASSARDEVIRVKASQVNELNDLLQELWIAQGQIEDEQVDYLKKITKDIQSIAVGMRTIDLSKLRTRTARLIRDLASETGKGVKFEFEGNGIEIDRSLVDALEEPLVHLVRNAIDHGIEIPEERVAAGKDADGTLSLTFTRKGGRIVMTLADDGKGINRNSIKEKALTAGLVDAESLEDMPERDLFALLLLPGFSTKEGVTSISGRGVGLDVVGSMVKQSGGKLLIFSEEGSHTRFELSFPLNTAIIEGMVVLVRGCYCVFPIGELVEVIEFDEDSATRVTAGKNLLDVRGEVVPLVELDRVFSFERCPATARWEAALILTDGDRKYAVPVEAIVQKAEVAIKPLGRRFAGVSGLSSGTIFAGGKIGFVLDTEAILDRVRG